ncbi:MAG TPA: protein kinase [Vicinamibacterales bacterium]|nr:protein kinase [Vicinamibacterales bacterium]
MQPERDYESLLESVADGAQIDWAALDASAATSAERTQYRNLRLVARVAELHRTLVLDEDAESRPTLVADVATPDPTTWGHLTVGARIASGSFGRIYRAHDSHLNRDVALKLLRGDITPSRPVERLLTEARTLAQVRHPNVVTVHGADVRDGRAGLWMELVAGQTLDAWLNTHGPMGAGEAATLGIDLCRALAAVHAAGLVHGDVKAQNVVREQGGRIVLMDFGAGRAQGGDAAGVAGTPMYLAGEVLAGEPPTIQSDLYSLGVLLFHLLTRAYPYTGVDVDGLRDAHADGDRRWLRDLRPDLPSELVQTIERALDPDPARRFTSAGEMERALGGALHLAPSAQPEVVVARRSWAMPAFALGALALVAVITGLIVWSNRTTNPVGVPEIKSIAVLPMKDLSSSTPIPYLADGLHDQLVITLGQIQSLRVLSRTSVIKFKDSTEGAGEIAKQLGVDVALESTVSAAGASDGGSGRVKVNASLVVAGANTPLWRGTFDGSQGDLLKLEGEIAREIAAKVRASIEPEESARLRNAAQTTPAAEAAFFQGRLSLEGYGAAAARRAVDSFERAIALDAEHAGAHAGAAVAYVGLAANGGMTHQKARALALGHAQRALGLRDDLAEAHAAMAFIAFLYDWNFKSAEEEYRKALDLNPNLVLALNQYAQLLGAARRFDESLAQALRVEATEPGSAPELKGLLLYYKRDYDAADKALRAALTGSPDVPGLHIMLGRVAEARGRLTEALEQTRAASELAAGGGVALRVQVVRLEALNGQTREAQKAFRQLQQDALAGRVQLTSRDVAYSQLAFGDKEGALRAFARAIDERDPSLVWLGVDPRVDSLRQDSRFVALLKQLGLP